MYSLLIVDDEPVIRRGIRKLIDFKALSIGKVYEASDGEKALGIFSEKQPDIILADVNMPKMDGLELAREIKKRNKQVRIAIITGYEYFEYALTALKAGVDDFVLKPVSKNDVHELLKKMVEDIRNDEADMNLLESLKSLQNMSNPGKEDSGYKKVIQEAMKNNMSNPGFSLLSLSQIVNLSAGHLSTVFKKIFGIPFHEYLITMRLQRAKIMLLSTGFKVYEVAEKVGFDDPNYFSTSFKKKYGVSPNKYRNLVAGGQA